MYGLNGILTACALGLLRALHLRQNYIGDIVPADFVSNTILASAWDRVTNDSNSRSSSSDEFQNIFDEDEETLDELNLEEKSKSSPFKTKIFNCTASKENPITWKMINHDMRRMYEIYPPKRGIWCNCFNFSRFALWFRVQVILYHFLPSLIGDLFLRLAKKKLRLLPIYRKVQSFTVALGFFTTNQWFFEKNNMRELCSR